MIRVIKSGKEKKFFAKCHWCASELKYEFSDINFTQQTKYLKRRRIIVCPVCGEEIDVYLCTKEEDEKCYPIFGCNAGC